MWVHAAPDKIQNVADGAQLKSIKPREARHLSLQVDSWALSHPAPNQLRGKASTEDLHWRTATTAQRRGVFGAPGHVVVCSDGDSRSPDGFDPTEANKVHRVRRVYRTYSTHVQKFTCNLSTHAPILFFMVSMLWSGAFDQRIRRWFAGLSRS